MIFGAGFNQQIVTHTYVLLLLSIPPSEQPVRRNSGIFFTMGDQFCRNHGEVVENFLQAAPSKNPENASEGVQLVGLVVYGKQI